MRTLVGRITNSLACAALTIAAACTPSLDVSHQYVDATTSPELGLHLGAQLLATFATGQSLPLTSNAVATIWTSPTTFVSTVTGGGGAVPVSVSGTAVDSDADLVADELDVTVTYSPGPSEDRILVRTDPFSDYRCFGGAGDCAPAFGTRSRRSVTETTTWSRSSRSSTATATSIPTRTTTRRFATRVSGPTAPPSHRSRSPRRSARWC